MANKKKKPGKKAAPAAPAANKPAERREIRNSFQARIKGESDPATRNELRREQRKSLKSLTV